MEDFELTKVLIGIGHLTPVEFATHAAHIALARNYAWKQLASREHSGDLYTGDMNYLASTTDWDNSPRKQRIYKLLDSMIPKNLPALDLGCATGMTGMTLLMHGYEHVTFCDFEGIQLDFLRLCLPLIPEFEGRWSIIPYGQEVAHPVVIALDVLEHVGKHLNFMRWVYELCDGLLALSYPVAQPFDRPYEFAVDGWVDDEVIGSILDSRWELLAWEVEENGRFALARKKDYCKPPPCFADNPFYDLGENSSS